MGELDDYGLFVASPGDEAGRASSVGARGPSQLPESPSAWARTRSSPVALIARNWTI